MKPRYLIVYALTSIVTHKQSNWTKVRHKTKLQGIWQIIDTHSNCLVVDDEEKFVDAKACCDLLNEDYEINKAA